MFPSSLLMKRTIFCFITQNHPELNLEPFSTHFCILRKNSWLFIICIISMVCIMKKGWMRAHWPRKHYSFTLNKLGRRRHSFEIIRWIVDFVEVIVLANIISMFNFLSHSFYYKVTIQEQTNNRKICHMREIGFWMI